MLLDTRNMWNWMEIFDYQIEACNSHILSANNRDKIHWVSKWMTMNDEFDIYLTKNEIFIGNASIITYNWNTFILTIDELLRYLCIHNANPLNSTQNNSMKKCIAVINYLFLWKMCLVFYCMCYILNIE